MSALLEIRELWGGYQEGVDILRGVSMEVQQGEPIGIIGLNGSGKSTLGKAIMGMIPYRRGSIVFEGEDITGLKTHELAHRGLAIMQQGGRVFPTLSVWDNLQLATQANNSEFRIRNSELAEIIPLLRRPKRELQRLMADKLSGGQKHQLSLAMTLATHPKLVILDEPSAGLSPIAVQEMYDMLNRIRDCWNITTMLIEQKISKSVSFCEKNLLVQHGTISDVFFNDGLSVIEYRMFNSKNNNL